MTEVITIKFKGRSKGYYFDPAGVTAVPGDRLVVETSKGMELGTVLEGNHMVEDSDTVQPLRPVVRKATADDLRVADINRSREAEAFDICKDMIRKHKLEMKLVDVECSFEGIIIQLVCLHYILHKLYGKPLNKLDVHIR